jgi:hypothetical protein
MKRANTFIF